MKKILFLLFVAFSSIGTAVADGRQCTTQQGTVKLDNQSMQSSKYGYVDAYLTFTSSNYYNRDCKPRVLVFCYDAATDKQVSVKSVEINARSMNVCFSDKDGIKPDHAYYFSLKLCD